MEQAKNLFIFLALLAFNALAMYWLAVTPDLLAAIGEFVDQYVIPGVMALGSTIAMFWLICKFRYIESRLNDGGRVSFKVCKQETEQEWLDRQW